MKDWSLMNEEGQQITVRAEKFSDLPVAFCVGVDEPTDIIKAEVISK